MEALQSYIDDDQWFLAARVNPELMTSHWLSPLQLHYPSESVSLPIKLGATASSGVQDLVVTVINDQWDGRAGVSNYPETELSRDCMLRDWSYEEMWTERSGIPADAEAAEGVDRLAWTTEYSWSVNGQSAKCDPCPEVPPEATTSDPFPRLCGGRTGLPWASQGYHITRLRLRYTPGGVQDDLVFYSSYDLSNQQNRYVVHKWELESLLPFCDGTQADDPGACYTSEYWARQAQDELDDPVAVEPTGCSTAGSRGWALVSLLGALALARRRRAA